MSNPTPPASTTPYTIGGLLGLAWAFLVSELHHRAGITLDASEATFGGVAVSFIGAFISHTYLGKKFRKILAQMGQEN